MRACDFTKPMLRLEVYVVTPVVTGWVLAWCENVEPASLLRCAYRVHGWTRSMRNGTPRAKATGMQGVRLLYVRADPLQKVGLYAELAAELAASERGKAALPFTLEEACPELTAEKAEPIGPDLTPAAPKKKRTTSPVGGSSRLRFRCDDCGAAIGEACIGKSGKSGGQFHKSRTLAFRASQESKSP